MPLTLQFTMAALTNVDDAAGLWQFEGGQVALGGTHTGNYASVKRVVFKGTDQDNQNCAMVTTTIFFLGNFPPESITLQGSHRFDMGHQIGSVSAASSAYAQYIGHQYGRDGTTNVVTVS